MKMVHLIGVLCVLFFSDCSKKTTGGSTLVVQPPIDKNWQFEANPVWSDEFDYTGKPILQNGVTISAAAAGVIMKPNIIPTVKIMRKLKMVN
jgi:hypothetical protein